MPHPLSETSRTLLRLLLDGHWHPLSEIKASLAARIAPGPAVRSYNVKEAHREAVCGPRVRGEPSLDAKITFGRTNMVAHAFNSLRKHHLETRTGPEPDTWEVRIRPDRLQQLIAERGLTPIGVVGEMPVNPPVPAAGPPPAADPPPLACPQCGLYIVNREQHDEFHLQHGGPPVAAFFCESQIRALVAEEVGRALDAFQRGMEDYLETLFADIVRHRRRRPRPENRALPEALRQ